MMDFMTQNSPCFICNKPNKTSSEDAINRLNSFLRRSEVSDKTTIKGAEQDLIRAFEMSNHERCPYGLPCQKLQESESRVRRIVPEVSRMIVAYILSDRPARELLRHLQGYYPQAYQVVERLSMNKKKEKTTWQE